MRKTRDPITGFRDRIIGAELAETSEIKAIELEVKQSVDADVKKAKVRDHRVRDTPSLLTTNL